MLKKLSLAALVAMGSMSFASATPLTQAIKNVDLNGMLRIRFYNESPKNKNNWTAWQTNGVFIFKIPVSENINFVFRNSTQTYLKYTESNDRRILKTAKSVDSAMTNNLLFMNYHQDGLNAIAGKIPVATPITSVSPATPTHGAGAIATYNVGNGFTVAGGFVTAMKNASGDNYNYTGKYINNDTYVAAGIYGSDAVKAQVWYFHVENLLKYDAIASADLDLFKLAGVQNNYNLQFHVDFAASKLSNSSEKTKKFFNANVKGVVAGANVKVGYSHSGAEIGVIDLSNKSPLAYSQAGTEQYWDMANAYDANTFYMGGCYPVLPKLKVGVAYAYTHGGSSASEVAGINFKNLNEYAVKAHYAYNKKLSFEGYYDYANFSGKGSSVNNKGELRLTALYKF